MDFQQHSEQFDLRMDAVGLHISSSLLFRLPFTPCVIQHIDFREVVRLFLGDGRKIFTGLLQGDFHGVGFLGL